MKLERTVGKFEIGKSEVGKFLFKLVSFAEVGKCFSLH